MAVHSSTLAWKIPWTEESGGLQPMGSQRVWWATAHGVPESRTRLSEQRTMQIEKASVVLRGSENTRDEQVQETFRAVEIFCSNDEYRPSHICPNPQKIQPQVQLISLAQSCLTLCDPTDCSTPGLPVHHDLPEFTQTHVDRVSDAIQPSHPLSPPSPPALNLSQHQGLFQ